MDPTVIIGNWIAKEIIPPSAAPQGIPPIDEITLSFDDMGMFSLNLDSKKSGECAFTGTEFWLIDEADLMAIESGQRAGKVPGISLLIDGDNIILDFIDYKIKFSRG